VCVCACVRVCKRPESECGIVCVCIKCGEVDFAAEVQCGRLVASQ
jgi:hypothetical protein